MDREVLAFDLNSMPVCFCSKDILRSFRGEAAALFGSH